MEIVRVEINTADIKLDQFLKWAGAAASGGEAKELIASQKIRVNGAEELRRGRKLKNEDLVEIENRYLYKVISPLQEKKCF